MRVAIPGKGLTIGRDPNQVDLVVDHPLVSRRHAQVAVHADGKLYLIDHQSRNGTFVNGHKLSAPVLLSPNDKIEFGAEGKVVFLYELADTTSVSGVLKEAFGETVAPVEWKVGDNILGIYEVTGILGQGGMGRVYKVHHKSWNMDLAVKSLRPDLFAEAKAVEDFIREAETWVNLNLHPNIVQCFYVRTIGGIPRIFAEYVPDGTLAEWIHHRKLTQLDQILDVAIQFAWGLHAAHEQGLVHQDVKPGNVLMTRDGTAQISDFGLARAKALATESAATGESGLVTMAGGTKEYKSPEQFRRERLSRKSDIWSWGLSVLQMFTGGISWEFGYQALLALASYQSVGGPRWMIEMPSGLQTLLERCFQDDPQRRPADMLEIADELQRIYQEECGVPYQRSDMKTGELLANGLNNRALSIVELGKRDEALKLWEEALQVKPGHVNSTYNHGLALWRSARITDDELVRRMTEVCASHPGNRYAQCLLALVGLERGEFVQATRILEKFAEEQQIQNAIAKGIELARSQKSKSRALVAEFPADPLGVNAAWISADCRMLVTGGLYTTVNLLETETGRCVQTFVGHDDAVMAVTADEHLKHILSGGKDATVRLWSIESGQCVRVLHGHSDIVGDVCFAADRRFAFSRGYDGLVKLWDLHSGECVHTFGESKKWISAVSLSRDSRTMLAAESDEALCLWDVTRRVILQRIPCSGSIVALDMARNGRIALASNADSSIQVWDLEKRRPILKLVGHSEQARSVLVSPDAQTALSAGEAVRLWDLATGRCLHTFPCDGSVPRSLATDPNWRWMASGGYNGVIRLWSLGLGIKPVLAPPMLSRITHHTKAFTFSNAFQRALGQARAAIDKGEIEAAANWIRHARSQQGYERNPQALNLWFSLYTRLPRRTLRGAWRRLTIDCGKDASWSVGLTSDGVFALTGHVDGTVRAWNSTTGECIRVLSGHSALVGTLSIHPLDPLVLTGSDDSAIKLWNFITGECLQVFEGHADTVVALAMSPDGMRLFSIDGDKNLRIWDVKSGRCLSSADIDWGGSLLSASFSSDLRSVLIGGSGGGLALFDITGRGLVRSFRGHDESCVVTSVVLSENNKNAVSWCMDGRLKLWNVRTGQCLLSIEAGAEHLSLSADGHFAAGGFYDSPPGIWDLKTGDRLKICEDHAGDLLCTALSRDARCLAVGSTDGKLRLWTLDWELENQEAADWNEAARPYLDTFLTVHTPYAGELPEDRHPTDDEIARAVTRHGTPGWNANDFDRLLYTLSCAGYGSLRPEGVRRELEKMAETRTGPRE